MLFNSPTFLFIFFPLSLFTLLFYNKINIQNFILLFFSIFFLYSSEPIFTIYVFVTIILDFFISKKFYYLKNEFLKKLILFLGIFYNLFTLILLKYLFFFLDLFNIESLNENFQRYDFLNLFLPLGISFITFTKISFLVDCFKKKVEEPKKISDIFLYIFLYPQLIAGPIIRYNQISDQITSRKISPNKIFSGVKLIIIGLGKKVLIADQLAPSVDLIFSDHLYQPSTFLIIYGTIAFTLQIYFDFSGYTDIAIGIGKIFGFSFPKNFNKPYLSKSVTDFWSRWHITLSRWFKDYLYIPLGGNKKNKIRTFFNLWVVFLLSGLWHGASMNFIIWGAFNGLFLFLEKIIFINKKFIKIFTKIYFLLFIFNSWLIFRIESTEQLISYYIQIFSLENIFNSNDKFIYFNFETIIIVLAMIYCFIDIKKYQIHFIRKFIKKNKTIIRLSNNIVLYLIFIISIIFIIFNDANNFIYFRF